MSKKVRALITLTRPPNAILMYIAVIAGILLSDAKSFQVEKLALALLTAYGLCGSSMGFNDYFDREVDKVNAPWRPIPSGAISEKEAIGFSAALALIGGAAAAITSLECFLVAALSFLAAFTYNAVLKKTGFLGNMVVSAIVVAPFIYGAILSDGYLSLRLITFIVPAYFANLGREVIKGISDIEGDALRDVRSIARIKGEGFASRLGALLYLTAVAISPLPYILQLTSWLYLPIVAVADLGFIFEAISILKDSSKANSLRVKNRTLGWMLIALLAFIAGSF